MDGDIVFSHVNLSFGERTVLRDCCAVFPCGRVTAITGPSGVGKTTLLNLALGLLHPDSGSVTGIRGRRMAAVFQEDRLCGMLSVRRNLLLVCPGLQEAQMAGHLERVGLGGELDTRVDELSGGMKRRAAIVRAVLAQPEVLVLDEPLRGLDAATREQVLAYLSDGCAGRTVLLVTHDEEEAQRLGASHRCQLKPCT